MVNWLAGNGGLRLPWVAALAVVAVTGSPLLGGAVWAVGRLTLVAVKGTIR